ncbi:MAG: putative nucleotidyltransferase substrate binding domain-containing protein [Pseudomonadota bacterium]
MTANATDFAAFAQGRAPFRALSPTHFRLLTDQIETRHVTADTRMLDIGDPVDAVFVIISGRMHLMSAEDELVTDMFAGEVFGHRSLLRNTSAILRVHAVEDTRLAVIRAEAFREVFDADPTFAGFFQRRAATRASSQDPAKASSNTLMTGRVGDIMTPSPATLPATASIRQAAQIMRDRHISCMLTTGPDGALVGIVTSGDLVGHVVAGANDATAPLSDIMATNPVTTQPDKAVLDAVATLTEHDIGHLPVTDDTGKPVGIITQTDLIRRNTSGIIQIISEIARQTTHEGLASVVARNPQLLVELVGGGVEGHQIGRTVTRITDAVTKRLITLAIEELGAPPARWLWLACGSQGRMEQTGVSDQDNCLFLEDGYDDAAHNAYFKRFATIVCDGLNTCGYVFCPGDMMATADRWRQPVHVWRRYFDGWIAKPDPMAQMLASVMFDLRPIAGDESLFAGLQAETLKKASADSIFRAHMTRNSLKHQPPLGLFGGLTYVRDGEHKNAVDLKHSGVVPITDLGRLYALQGRIEAANTRDRIIAARDMEGVLSKSGGDDLVDAYDLIVDLRLKHQASQIRAGDKPDNFMVPDALSALERNHLKDAFAVVKTLQSAVGYGKT